jgi:hypothetical protein
MPSFLLMPLTIFASILKCAAYHMPICNIVHQQLLSFCGQKEWHQSPIFEVVLSFSAATRSSGRPSSQIAIPPSDAQYYQHQEKGFTGHPLPKGPQES